MKDAKEKRLQDEVVLSYINALEAGNREAAEKCKKDIMHYAEVTDFDFSASEVIAMYAHLTNKRKAYEHLLKHELLPKFHLPEDEIMLLCALRYGFIGMLNVLIAKDESLLNIIKKFYLRSDPVLRMYRVYNPASVNYVITKYTDFKIDHKQLLECAVEGNDFETLDYALKQYTDHECGIYEALKYSGRAGNLEMTKYCISKGADPIMNGNVAVEAAKYGHINVLQFVANHYPKCITQFAYGILSHAIASAQLECIQYLVKVFPHMKDIKIQDKEFSFEVWCNTSATQILEVVKFCEQSLKVSFNRNYLFLCALEYRHIHLVDYLMNCKNPVRFQSFYREKLMASIGYTSVEILYYLIDKGLGIRPDDIKPLVEHMLIFNKDWNVIRGIACVLKVDLASYIAENVRYIFRRADNYSMIRELHSLGYTAVCDQKAFDCVIQSGCFDLAEYISILNQNVSSSNQDYAQYLKLCGKLSENAHPLVIAESYYKMQLPMIKDANTMQYTHLSQLTLPREVEVINSVKYQSYNALVTLRLLYLEYNQCTEKEI